MKWEKDLALTVDLQSRGILQPAAGQVTRESSIGKRAHSPDTDRQGGASVAVGQTVPQISLAPLTSKHPKRCTFTPDAFSKCLISVSSSHSTKHTGARACMCTHVSSVGWLPIYTFTFEHWCPYIWAVTPRTLCWNLCGTHCSATALPVCWSVSCTDLWWAIWGQRCCLMAIVPTFLAQYPAHKCGWAFLTVTFQHASFINTLNKALLV